jgi:hypothetical protein
LPQRARRNPLKPRIIFRASDDAPDFPLQGRHAARALARAHGFT